MKTVLLSQCSSRPSTWDDASESSNFNVTVWFVSQSFNGGRVLPAAVNHKTQLLITITFYCHKYLK